MNSTTPWPFRTATFLLFSHFVYHRRAKLLFMYKKDKINIPQSMTDKTAIGRSNGAMEPVARPSIVGQN
jgi:hypothetical protein|tara:strand:- start:65 stop:271 length:207 start_codon:yes stop_codon:yes gene_type:complete